MGIPGRAPPLAPGPGGDRTSAWPVPKIGTPAECHAAIFPWGALRKTGALGGTPRVPAPGLPRAGALLTSRGCRDPLVPGRAKGGLDSGTMACTAPAVTRAASASCDWPEALRAKARTGERGLAPRGALFEMYVHDAVEPRRSGIYQFCIVGIDLADPEHPSYHAWEPTGHFDRSFTFDEVDQRLTPERFGRAWGGGARPALGQRSGIDAASAHRKDGANAGRAVRWPDFSGPDSLLHGRALPEVDAAGQPTLPFACAFRPRNSVDLLHPMVLAWEKRRATPAAPIKALVLDGSGRFAAFLQGRLAGGEVLAIDDPPRYCQAPLRRFRDGCRFPVRAEGAMDRFASTLHFDDDAFDVVVLPFVLARLCGGEEPRFLALVREAARVASGFVLVAEDLRPPAADEAALRRWKSVLQADWRAPVLLDGELRSGAVEDHFLGRPLAAASGADEVAFDGARRFLIVQASTFCSHRQPRQSRAPAPAAPGAEEARLLGARETVAETG